jgi:hypothetical protein
MSADPGELFCRTIPVQNRRALTPDQLAAYAARAQIWADQRQQLALRRARSGKWRSRLLRLPLWV